MSKPRRVVVIGGGVIGASCAYYLAKADWQVTLIDQAEFGRGCSHANCGFVCPSHILPLAGPGAIQSTLRALLRRSSPFSIKPRADPALWRWLLQFARRCNQADMLNSGRAISAILNSSRRRYDELFQSEPFDAEFERRGLLFVFLTVAAMEHYEDTDQLLSQSFGMAARRYGPNELVELEPALKSGLAGGWHYPGDAHLRPDKLMSSWRRVLANRGVHIREQCAFKQFIIANGLAHTIETSCGELSAEAFVLSTGAWTPRLKLDLGCRLPIQPGKGYSMTMPRPARCPKIPLIFEEHRVAVTPMQSGYRLGSIMEFAGYDSSLDPRRLDLLKQGAGHYLHEPLAEPVLEQWYGWRPMTYDSLPIIGQSPALPNVYLAVGHNMLGLSMAPATGKLIAELVGGQAPHIDPAPYAASRF